MQTRPPDPIRRVLFLPIIGIAVWIISCSGNGSTSTTVPLQPINSSGGVPGTSATIASAACDTNTILWGGNTAATPVSANESGFIGTGSMSQPRAGHTTTLLPNGKVLVIDGGQLDIDDLLVSIVSAEIFDPSQEKFTPTGSPCIAREFHTATLLPNGKVLVAGGNEFSGYPTFLAATPTAELYDSAAGTFSATGSMSVARSLHTATLLTDGRVLIVGGSPSGAPAAEVYDPVAGAFSATANMPATRLGHTATLLRSGEVLIVGGQNEDAALATAELYDPKTNSFTATGSMSIPRTGHAATLLNSGNVLVTGGASSKALTVGSLVNVIPQMTAELFDPLSGTFAPTASMNTGRIGHTATLLANGSVLIAGGFIDYARGGPASFGYQSTGNAEIYDPVTSSFTLTGPMNTARFWHTATVLPDGTTLITGGIGSDLALASDEIYK